MDYYGIFTQVAAKNFMFYAGGIAGLPSKISSKQSLVYQPLAFKAVSGAPSSG
jgi:hypothetical protein